LLILTNDSAMAMRLTDPIHHIPKTYHVKIVGHLTEDGLRSLAAGVWLVDGLTRPARAKVLGRKGPSMRIELILTEGRNRQVRRMMQTLGHKVKGLRRVAVGTFVLGDLAPGQCRVLAPEEVVRLTQG